MSLRWSKLIVLALLTSSSVFSAIDDYNVVWRSPSQNHHGSMPVGNGDIGLNVWVEPSGDLCFYIGKTDSWGDNGRLLKVGKVRISLSPNPLTKGAKFTQTLNLKNGEITIAIKGENPTVLKVWVDANNPLIQIETTSTKPIQATAKMELWRTKQEVLSSITISDTWNVHPAPAPKTTVEPDTILDDWENGIGWYHLNRKSVGPDVTMKWQGLDDFKGYRDPLKNRIFGAVITANNGKRETKTTLTTASRKSQSIRIAVHTLFPGTIEAWKSACRATLAKTNTTARYLAHTAWWRQFWNRSHIEITQNTSINQILLPNNALPLFFGCDQKRLSRFKGELRVSVNQKVLNIEALKARHAAGAGNVQAVKIGEAYNGKLTKNMTIEAWIKPNARLNPSRIVDKISAGSTDGLLLDIYPSNGIRLIVGNKVLNVKNSLTLGKWNYIAAVIDSTQNKINLYVNGKFVSTNQNQQQDDAYIVARGYNLQRFIDAAGGRGKYPIKFNGSIFNVAYAGKPGDADYRQWGGGYWWQNTRLPYLSMTMAGDFEMLHSLFRMYTDDILPVAKHRTQKYFGHAGAFFSECTYPWGATFSRSYGWEKPFKDRKDPLQSSSWHKWEWVAGPELVWMMLDYYDYTRDEVFLKEKIIPTAEAVIKFFDLFYKQNDKGELVMYPAMACETWWDCTNPMPELSGLYGITERLIALPTKLADTTSRNYWKTFLKKLAPLPLRDTASGKALAPGTKFANHKNFESPELYGVFPFRRIAVGRDNIEWGINALNHRWHRGFAGWSQDDLFMAYLGQTKQAKENVVKRARKSHRGSRFPAFWGPNFDWIPDQDHGGVLTKAVQSMLMQVDPYSNKIYLLPAWPKEWNADFKLHAPGKTVIEAKVRDGKIVDLNVTPASRLKDVTVK